METDPNMVSDVRVTYMEMMCILKTERTESSVLLTDSLSTFCITAPLAGD